jgi:hypothetical protein
VAAPADSADPASTEEAKPSYMASSHTDVDPFDDGYLRELGSADGRQHTMDDCFRSNGAERRAGVSTGRR